LTNGSAFSGSNLYKKNLDLDLGQGCFQLILGDGSKVFFQSNFDLNGVLKMLSQSSQKIPMVFSPRSFNFPMGYQSSQNVPQHVPKKKNREQYRE
jgi:hypothetical protein